MKETQAVEQPNNHLGPGNRLQAARIAAGLTLEDVASKMHLSTAILSNLEANDFDEITAPIFVKGYLRSYARIVALDEQEIIAEYAAYANDGDPPILSTSNTTPEINSNDSRVKLTTRLVILLLAGLLVVWWWNRHQESTETVSLDTGIGLQTENGEAGANQPVADQSLRVEPESGPVAQVDAATVAVINQEMAAELEQNIIDHSLQEADQAAEIAESENAIGEQGAEVEPNIPADNDQTPRQPTTGGAPVVETPAEPMVVADPTQGLVISVVADTWADIRDADGNKLVYDLLRSGRRVEVDGKAPIKAFLGNGYGVSVEYRGVPMDLSAKIRADNTVRFSIGQ